MLAAFAFSTASRRRGFMPRSPPPCAENFSRLGGPVSRADVKGDLTGITQPGTIGAKLAAVLKERGIEPPTPAACPATLWDVYASDKAAQGHPVRATVSDM